ncbi:MAG: Pvc16 family protein, partial [Rhodoplanes sp.]
MPSRSGTGGERLTNAPLALDLHYVMIAYGRADFQAEILLGYGMHLLHERPVLDRAAIRRALNPTPIEVHLFLLTGGGSLPLMRVVLAVTINGSAESIIDGVTTNVEAQPGEGGVCKLVVKGKDMSALMDVIDFPGLLFPAMPPSGRVLLV